MSEALQTEKGMPEWGPEYLIALDKAEGYLAKAAKMIGKSYSTTYKARLASNDFFNAVEKMKAEWDSRHLAELEEISMTQAKKPGNVTERIFNMKSLAPHKYRDKHIETKVGKITIVYGFQIGLGDGPDRVTISPTGEQIDGQYEVSNNNKISSEKEIPLPRPTLLPDTDIDIDLYARPTVDRGNSRGSITGRGRVFINLK